MFFRQQKPFKSNLFNQNDFYRKFIQDLEQCSKEAIIESPYVTANRMEVLYPILKKLLVQKVKVIVVTRDPIDHEDEYFRDQACNEMLKCMDIGIKVVFLTGNHHRKIAIIDRTILWEGSLNILSHKSSLEIMRRVEDERFAKQMLTFLKVV